MLGQLNKIFWEPKAIYLSLKIVGSGKSKVNLPGTILLCKGHRFHVLNWHEACKQIVGALNCSCFCYPVHTIIGLLVNRLDLLSVLKQPKAHISCILPQSAVNARLLVLSKFLIHWPTVVNLLRDSIAVSVFVLIFVELDKSETNPNKKP